MKLPTILIYATFCLYANLSLSHEQKDLYELEQYRYGEMKNLSITKTTKTIDDIEVFSSQTTKEIIPFGNNRVSLVNFWATWCGPCREEMPSLDKLSKSIDSKDFSIIIIAAGRNSESAIDKFFSKNNIYNLKSYRDPKGKVTAGFGVFGLPTTIIVDQHAKEIARLVGGANWNSVEAIKIINVILNSHKNN